MKVYDPNDILCSLFFATVMAVSWTQVKSANQNEASLLHGAKKIATTGYIAWGVFDRWISNHEVAHISRRSPDSSDWTVSVHNTNSGMSRKMSRVSGLITMTGCRGSFFPSPNGQWNIWIGKNDAYFGAPLNGSRIVKWKSDGSRRVLWMNDGQRWVSFIQSSGEDRISHAFVRRASDPKMARRVNFTAGDLPDWIGIQTGVISSSGQLVYENTRRGNVGQFASVEIVKYDLSRQNPKSSKATFRNLPSGSIEDLKLSPEGDRIAWLIYTGAGVIDSPMLSRSIKRSQKDMSARVFVSRIDGQNMREVGHLPVKVDEKVMGASAPGYLRGVDWLPDGKHLTFALEGAIYIIPAG